MNAKHTDTPWHMDGLGVVSGGPHGLTTVCTVPLLAWEKSMEIESPERKAERFSAQCLEEAKANGKLIEAAPDLLRACQAALAYWDSPYEANRKAALEIIERSVRKAVMP